MNENNELIEAIYKDATMASFTLTQLLKELKEKDNKIKKTIENILKGYERYIEIAKKQLVKQDINPSSESFIKKMGAKAGIKSEIKKDNSDSRVADMLIKGLTMGTIDMEKKIKNYEETTEKNILKFAQDFLQFQNDNIESLKKHL